MTNYQRSFISIRALVLFSFFFITCNVPIENSFKEITGEDLPKNAQILQTEDSPTDVHGDFGRILIVKVGVNFYDILPKKLLQKGLQSTIEDPINEFEEVTNNIDLSKIVSRYKYSGNSVYYWVGFYSDKETIMLIRSSW